MMVLFNYPKEKIRLKDLETPAINIKTALAAGASFDAAKMAQTPQALQGRLNRALGAEDAAKAVAAERSKIEKFDEAAYQASQDLIKKAAELNSLEARIPNILLNRLRQQTSEARPIEKIELSDEVKAKLSQELRQAVESGASVRKSLDGKDQIFVNGAWVDADQLGADVVYGGLSGQKIKDIDELRQLFEQVAAAIPDRLDVEVTQYNLAMTHEELQAALREELSLLNKAAREKFVFRHLSSSLAERAAQVAALGAASRYSPEEKVNNILAQIEDGDTVEVFGRQLEIKDLIDNDYLKSIVKGALENPAELERLKKDKNFSELGQYIERNKAAWNELFKTVEALAGGADAAKALYDSVTKWGNGTGSEIPPELLHEIFPQFYDIRALYTPQGQAALAALKNLASLSDYQGRLLAEKVQLLRGHVDVGPLLRSTEGINRILSSDPNEIIAIKSELDALKQPTFSLSQIYGQQNAQAVLDYYNLNFAIQQNPALSNHAAVVAANKSIEYVLSEIDSVINELNKIDNPFDPRAKDLLARLNQLKSQNLQALVNNLSQVVSAAQQEQTAQEKAKKEIEQVQRQVDEQKRKEDDIKFKADFDKIVNAQYPRVALGVSSNTGFVVGNATVDNMLKAANNLLGAGGHEFVHAINVAFTDNPAKWSGNAPKQLFDLANKQKDADPVRLAIAVYRQPQSLMNMTYELIKLYARKAGVGAAVENNYSNFVKARLGYQNPQPNNPRHAAKVISATLEYLKSLKDGPRDKYLKQLEDLLAKVETALKTQDIFPGFRGDARLSLWK